MRKEVSPEAVGSDILGPVVAEFCLRLWSLVALIDAPDDTAFLFCARGGLRMQLAYERFVSASALPSPLPPDSLMVSRLAAIRPALMQTVERDLDTLVPSAANALHYEFPGASLSDVAVAITGTLPGGSAGTWDSPLSPGGMAALLKHRDGQQVVAALADQSDLFRRHLRSCLSDRRQALLVDTGLFGTTRQLLAEGVPDVEFSSALIARSSRPGLGPRNANTFGLSVEAKGYSALRRRTTLLRYWHFFEWLFEPELPSVRTFEERGGVVRSNLEVDGWRDRVLPTPGSAFAGVIAYLDALPHGPAERIVLDADQAWTELRRAIVWPDRAHGNALLTGLRSHDFGTDATWSARPWRGPVAALRGSTMWREGEIARSASTLRLPLLASIETAYSVRNLWRAVCRMSGKPDSASTYGTVRHGTEHDREASQEPGLRSAREDDHGRSLDVPPGDCHDAEPTGADSSGGVRRFRHGGLP